MVHKTDVVSDSMSTATGSKNIFYIYLKISSIFKFITSINQVLSFSLILRRLGFTNLQGISEAAYIKLII